MCTIQVPTQSVLVEVCNYYINQGITEITLQYPDGAIRDGEFVVCVGLSGGIQGCDKGYDSEAKKPEYVHVNVQGGGDPTPFIENGNSQSQSQSSNNDRLLSELSLSLDIHVP